MKKLAAIIFAVIFLLAALPAAAVTDSRDDAVRKVISGYFQSRYESLSKLALDKALDGFLDPVILKAQNALSEHDVLEAIIAYRKAQANNLDFTKYKYELAYQAINFSGSTAKILLDESYELYFTCAPTVKNSALIEHSLSMRLAGGRWYIVSDDYQDAEGVKKLLSKYFVEDRLGKADAIRKIVSESGNGIEGRLTRLDQIAQASKGISLILSLNSPIVWASGKASLIAANLSVTPLIRDGKLLLPLRLVFEKLGAEVDWEGSTRTVTAAYGSHKAVGTVGSDNVTIDGVTVKLPAPLTAVNGRIFIDAGVVELLSDKELYRQDELIIIHDGSFKPDSEKAFIGRLNEFYSAIFSKADFPRIDGSTATYPLTIEAGKVLLGLDDTGAKGFLTHNTTHNAYVNLIAKKADIIFVTQPSPEELKLAADSGIELEVVPVCKEGFVFLVNEKNPVSNLTSQQIRDVYQGRTKNWKELGGEDAEIIPYQREANSGSQTIMETTVMKGMKMVQPPKEVLVYGMGELIDRIADYSNARNSLGYSVYYYATSMYQKRAVKLLSIDGVKPDKTTIGSESYPFVVSYYAVMRKSDPDNSSARRLLNWILGEEGQSVVDTAGFVPMK